MYFEPRLAPNDSDQHPPTGKPHTLNQPLHQPHTTISDAMIYRGKSFGKSFGGDFGGGCLKTGTDTAAGPRWILLVFHHASTLQTHRCFSQLDDCKGKSFESKTDRQV